MENLLGLLRVRVIRGINLVVRDVHSSDPYVTIKMGKQKFKTRVIKNNLNPQWNEELTLSVLDPDLPIKLTVYDHDMFSKDDKMGDAEFEIKPFLQAMRMDLEGLQSGTVVTRITPSRTNCLSEESRIIYSNGKIIQNMCFRLRNVQRGEIEIQLQWINIPGCKGI